jgi:hypothetical protein
MKDVLAASQSSTFVGTFAHLAVVGCGLDEVEKLLRQRCVCNGLGYAWLISDRLYT